MATITYHCLNKSASSSILIFGVTLVAMFTLSSQQIATNSLLRNIDQHRQLRHLAYSPITGQRSTKINHNYYVKHYNSIDKVTTTTRLNKNSNRNANDNEDYKGVQLFNRLLMESFIKPTFLVERANPRAGRRRGLSEIPSTISRVVRGLTNFTVTIGRTINSENVNGSLSKLITNRLVGVSESLMGWVERSVDDLPSIPRLDAQECMKRSICEAHNQPKKYGAVGLVIQLFFPPYLDAEDASKVVSKYQLAARYGRGENANCSAQYDGCMVNILDVLQGAINMIF